MHDGRGAGRRHGIGSAPDPPPLRTGGRGEGLLLKWQYTHGVADESLIAPETYLFDAAMMASPGNLDIQLDLILNYARNVAQYPEYQAYFRRHQPLLLAVWGRNDPFFLPAGAEAWKRDIPTAEIRFHDTGHFALETHAAEIGAEIRSFLDRHLRH
jgi:pimeloyl-ACP methyl ester carboxylesterase